MNLNRVIRNFVNTIKTAIITNAIKTKNMNPILENKLLLSKRIELEKVKV